MKFLNGKSIPKILSFEIPLMQQQVNTYELDLPIG
jgi:hypothetical protein